MKTVSGKIVSSKSISLSKASRILSKFSSSDNGASPSFAAYLKRASASFIELVQLHKDFKGNNHFVNTSAILDDCTSNSVKKPFDDEKLGFGEINPDKGGNFRIDSGMNNDHVLREVGIKRGSDVDNAIDVEGNRDKKKKKKKKERIKEENNDDGVIESKEKNRDKSNKEKFDGVMKVKKEVPSWNGGDKEVTMFVESDGSRRKKQKKKKKAKEEKESSFRKDQGDGVDTKVYESNKSAEEKRYKKKWNREAEEIIVENKFDIKEHFDNVDRKRKHKGDATEGLDYSEEQHRPKKKKK